MAQGVDHTGYVSIGTGIAETQLAELTIPKGVKQIVGIEPIVCSITPTAAQSVIAAVKVTSTDMALYNCQFMANPQVAILGATGQQHVGKSKFWPLYVPVNGGEKIQLKGTALVANAVAPFMGCSVYYSDQPPVLPQRKGKLGTLTSTGTAVAKVVSDAAFQITGGSILETAYAVVVPTTVLASNPMLGFGQIVSADILPPFPIKFPTTAVGPVLGALGAPTYDGIVEADVALAMASTTNMELSYSQQSAITNAGNFVIGVTYV